MNSSNIKTKNSFLTRKASPNILVYFIEIDISKDEEKLLLEKMNQTTEAIYGINRFVIYRVKKSELNFDSKLYSASILLLVSKQNESTKHVPSEINIPDLKLDWNLLCPNGIDKFDRDYFSKQMLTCISKEDALLSYDLMCNQSSLVYLFNSSTTPDLWSQISHINEVNLICYKGDDLPENSKSNDVLFVDLNQLGTLPKLKAKFDAELYFDNLEGNLGKPLLFSDKYSSTMELANRFKQINGIIAITNYQQSGIGRNNNKWLSPQGCAMFTVNLLLGASDPICSRISLIQHLASLSVILALPNELNIKIKWPNDILYMKSMSKLTGILVRTYVHGSSFNVQIGIGVNVSNRLPSVCLDDIIEFHNSQMLSDTDKHDLIPKETLIAKIISHLEKLLNMLGEGRLEEIKQIYCSKWIHSNVRIEVRDIVKQSQRKAVICGIDDNGYLLASDAVTGEKISLQPDGNRFDLMHNLVVLNC